MTDDGVEIGLGMFARAVRRSIRAGEHDCVTVRIAQPEFPMIGTAVATGRVAMAWHDDLGVQALSARNRRVEVAQLEPEEHAVSVRS